MNDILEILKNPSPEIDNEIIKEPSKRWRNKWQAGANRVKGECPTCGGLVAPKKPFEVYWAHCTWPSKEIAEQKALFSLKFIGEQTYFGAFPE